MKIRKSKTTWRNGLGLGQIMATLLVVLPTIAFSVTFLLAYWNVMQVDYKLKLIANVAAEFANSSSDPQSDFTDLSSTSLFTMANKLCPKGTTIAVKPNTLSDANSSDVISIVVEYVTPVSDAYLGGTVVSTNIQTYSYNDKNMSVTLECQ
jgi:hypothetical protein